MNIDNITSIYETNFKGSNSQVNATGLRLAKTELTNLTIVVQGKKVFLKKNLKDQNSINYILQLLNQK